MIGQITEADGGHIEALPKEACRHVREEDKQRISIVQQLVPNSTEHLRRIIMPQPGSGVTSRQRASAPSASLQV